MAHGGKREGSGRPLGSRNRRTEAREAQCQRAAAVIEAALDEPFTGDAHALLMAIYKDTKMSMDLRIDAAKAAIRYERPALSTVDVNSFNDHVIHEVSHKPLSPEEWEAAFCNPHTTEQ